MWVQLLPPPSPVTTKTGQLSPLARGVGGGKWVPTKSLILIKVKEVQAKPAAMNYLHKRSR